MNKNLLIGLGVLVLVIVGGFLYILLKGSPTTNQPTSQKTTQTSEPKIASGSVVEIKDFKYSPSTLTVKAGEKITVTNKDIPGHSVTSDTEGLFDTGILSKDESGTITAPSTAGSYGFHCTAHPSIKGILIVK